MISCVVHRAAATCTVFVEASVSMGSDADLLTVGRSVLAPFAVEVTYLYDFGTALWAFRVRVLSLPVRCDGVRGKTTRALSWHEDDVDEAPQWVRDFVRANHPPALPDLERTGS